MSDDAGGGDRFGLVGQVLDGRYRVDRVVGEGGFATVYAGVHLGLDAPVALKVLHLRETLESAQRAEVIAAFQREARTIARLRHPNIVQVLDTGVTNMPVGGHAPWMALEWLDGHTLDAELDARHGCGGTPPREALALLRPAFDAVAFAHEQSVAHRDLKPANLMFVAAGRARTLKVLDFGIAKVLDAGELTPGAGLTQTRGTLMAFSPRYAAPEQLTGTRTGPWTDVHALALMFTELLIGRPAYAGTELAQIYAEAFAPQRPTPGRHGVDVGEACESVLARALAFKPDERYRNAREMLEALEAARGAHTPGGSDAGIAPAAGSLQLAAAAPSSPAAGHALATTTDMLRAAAAQTDALADLAVQQAVTLSWLARWAADQTDPLPAAYARSTDVEAMMHVLRLAGRLDTPALRALLREDIDLQAFTWEKYRPWTSRPLADAIRRAVPRPPTLAELRAAAEASVVAERVAPRRRV